VVTADLVYVFHTANLKKSGVSVNSDNTSQKMFVGNDTISKIVCYQSVSVTVSQKNKKKCA
jgi:hypothetical protein